MLTSFVRTMGTRKSMLQLSSVIVAIGLTFKGSQILIVPDVDAVAKKPLPTETSAVISLESTSLMT